MQRNLFNVFVNLIFVGVIFVILRWDMLLVTFDYSAHPCVVQTDVVHEILHDAVNVLIKCGEGYVSGDGFLRNDRANSSQRSIN